MNEISISVCFVPPMIRHQETWNTAQKSEETKSYGFSEFAFLGDLNFQTSEEKKNQLKSRVLRMCLE